MLVESFQLSEKFSLELISEDKNGNEEVPGGLSDLVVRCKTAARNNAVHMDMVVHFLIPGMEDLNNTGCRAKIFGVCGQLQECSSAAFVEEAVEQFLVTVNERIKLVRQSKHHMKV